jgi:hypothetical protein
MTGPRVIQNEANDRHPNHPRSAEFLARLLGSRALGSAPAAIRATSGLRIRQARKPPRGRSRGGREQRSAFGLRSRRSTDLPPHQIYRQHAQALALPLLSLRVQPLALGLQSVSQRAIRRTPGACRLSLAEKQFLLMKMGLHRNYRQHEGATCSVPYLLQGE